MSRNRLRGFLAALLALSLAAPPARAQIFPLQPGEIVVTCYADPTGFVPNPYVLGIVDVRDPACDPTAERGRNWPAPGYHNEMPNPTGDPADEWTFENLGQVFGLTLDDADPPNIYTTSTSVYLPAAAELASGRVFRLDGTDGSISVLADLPNQLFDGLYRPGLGNIAFDRDHGQFFVTNMEDGRLYRLSRTGAVLETFDPFAPDDGLPGFAPRGERLWAVGVHGCRVYFSVWSEDCGERSSQQANTIWSVGMDPDDGSLRAQDLTLEITLPQFSVDGGPLHSNPVADLEFSEDGRMLVGERTMLFDIRTNAHQSRVLEYIGTHGSWVLNDPNRFRVGQADTEFACGLASHRNASGGVDYECDGESPCDGDGKIWVTGDALALGADGLVYGVQGTSRDGGGPEESWLVDLDNDVVNDAKTLLGDVDVFRGCRSPGACRAVDDGELRCAACEACTDPGLCTARVPCDGGIALCAGPEGFEPPGCSPEGPFQRGLTEVEVSCRDDAALCPVRVRDCEPPRCQAPSPLRLECTGPCGVPSDHPDLDPWLEQLEAEDNCAVAGVAVRVPSLLPSACGTGASSEVVFSVRDEEGYEATCTGSVIVVDTTDPEIQVPTPMRLECTGLTGVPADAPSVRGWLASARAEDRCGLVEVGHDAPSAFPFACEPGAETRVTWTAADTCGNTASGTSGLTVVDTTAPEVTAPAPLSLECEGPGGVRGDHPAIRSWLGGASARDLCGSAGLEKDAPPIFPTGCGAGAATPVRFRASDACGNEAVETSFVAVTDTMPPKLIVPPPLELECQGEEGTPVAHPEIQAWLGSARAADLCGEVFLTHDAPAVFPAECGAGTATPVTFTATDRCGNRVQAASTVTIRDTTPPRARACGGSLCLWPPNHAYVCLDDMRSRVQVEDACGEAEVIAVECRSNQCDDAPCAEHPGQNGDGSTTRDCFYDADQDRLCARAERAGTDPDGRTYSVTFITVDECGLVGADVGLTLTVPHDQDPHRGCLSPPPAGERGAKRSGPPLAVGP